MRYVLTLLAALAIASPAFAGGHNNHGQPSTKQADRGVALAQHYLSNVLSRPGTPQSAIDMAERHLQQALDYAARAHAACGC